MTLAEQVLDILADVAETDEVRRDPHLRLFATHVVDSLQTVDLVVRVCEVFDIEISPAEFDREAWATPLAIIEDVERRVNLRDAAQASGRGPDS